MFRKVLLAITASIMLGLIINGISFQLAKNKIVYDSDYQNPYGCLGIHLDQNGNCPGEIYNSEAGFPIQFTNNQDVVETQSEKSEVSVTILILDVLILAAVFTPIVFLIQTKLEKKHGKRTKSKS